MEHYTPIPGPSGIKRPHPDNILHNNDVSAKKKIRKFQVHVPQPDDVNRTVRANNGSAALNKEDLKLVARRYGIKSVSKLKKQDLLDAIEKIEYLSLKKHVLENMTIRKIRRVAKEFNLNLGGKTNKSDLIEILLSSQHRAFGLFLAEFADFHQDIFHGPRPQRRCPFTLVTIGHGLIKKYSTTQTNYQIRLEKGMNVEAAVFGMLKEATVRANYRKGDKIQVVASHPEFHHDISVVLNTTGGAGKISKDDARAFIEHLSNILTSNQTIHISQVTFYIRVTNIPRGAGRAKILNLRESKHTKKSITQIKNTDNLCCARAIVVGLTHHSSVILGRSLSPSEIKNIRLGRPIQKQLALKLCEIMGSYNHEGFTLEDIQRAEQCLDVQVKVICAENFNTVIYKGTEKKTKIYLYKDGNHFDVINRVAGFFCSSYYCHTCDTAYHNKESHECKTAKNQVCKLCMGKLHNILKKFKIYCSECNRYCYNQNCFDDHAKVCRTAYKCLTCNKICERSKNHVCGYGKCRNCQQEFEKIHEHKCYMQYREQKGGLCQEPPCVCNGNSNKKAKGCTYTEKYIFFDYEANQETNVHEANLVVAWRNTDDTKHVFRSNDEFCKWLISKEHRGFTAIAHNAKGYDSHFILKYCVENTLKPYTIYSGTKLLMLEIKGSIKVIDSSNFVVSRLSDFPKTFGLEEMKKGYFPHYFNTTENQNYVGPIPDIRFYGADSLKPKDREDFLKWHKQRVEENYVFDFQKELLEYCQSDVDILGRGCLELRKRFLEIANIDPFQYVTIASVCMVIYRSKYLPNNTIASIRENRKDQFSVGSITWLSQFPSVRHALNGGEVMICGSKVDGFDESTNTVYQYHGCFWHGCPKCFHETTINNVNHETMDDLHEKTIERSRQITDAGYQLVEMWECEWLKSKEYRKAKKLAKNIIEPLNPRDAFYGGRTNASKLKVKNKVLKYIDVCSLYPTVQYFDYYPVGHPHIITRPETYDPNWYGLIKCKILAPKGLYHPVLPVKYEKLLFVLCQKCFDEKCDHCTHSEEERALVGTWTTDEVKKAIEKDYRIIDVYEVWHFEEKSNELFKGYVKDFMKIKLETSPWKEDFETVEDYILAVKQCLDIDLQPENIVPNPGKRAVAKICLNSLWGKFGQRNNMAKSEYVTTAKRFYELLLDDRLEISQTTFLNEDIVQVTYKYLNEYVEDSFSTNVFIAAFTTSNARLRLYDMLDKLGNNVAYYDTDSVVYIEDDSVRVKTGSMLGEWTDELGKGIHITEWASTGPKSYAYALNNGKEVAKVKGFTLNYENSQLLNRRSMEEIIDKQTQHVELKYNMITRNKENKTLVNKLVAKKFKFEYDKRMIMRTDSDDTIETLPWGY